MSTRGPWNRLFARVRCVYRADLVYPPLPTDDQLDALERSLGVALPASYRAFALRFGLGGRMHSLVEMLPLVGRDQPVERWWRDVETASRYHRSTAWDPDWVAQHPGLLERIVVFAQDGGYHTWLFQPDEPTPGQPLDYAVYDIPRHETPERVTDSFTAWLSWMDEGYRPDEDELAGDEADDGFDWVYLPGQVRGLPLDYHRTDLRAKQTPHPDEVQRWLRANHGAVRRLADAYRTGEANAGPILADALLDAGCEHADLLHFCRHGDTRIDGPWIVRVLLSNENR